MKKGFTLVELLGVIVIIALLLLLIIPAVINGISNRQDEATDAQKNIIYRAADELLASDADAFLCNEGDVYCIPLRTLVDAGLLEESIEKAFGVTLDARMSLDKTAVRVHILEKGVREYELVDKAQCDNTQSRSIAIIVNPSNKVWSREKNVTIMYPNLGSGYTNQYKIGEGAYINTNSTTTMTFDKEIIIDTRVVKGGKVEVSKQGTVERIDRQDPKVVDHYLVGWAPNDKVQVDIVLTDTRSGVAGYCIKKDQNKPKSVDDKCFVKFELPEYGGLGTATEFLSVGTYYVFVKDRAGNISGYDDKENSKAKIVVDDVNPPTLKIATSSTTRSITAVSDAYALSGISKYEFAIDDGDWIDNGDSNVYKFDKLKRNSSHTIKSRVTSKAGKTKKAVSAKTLNIPAPTFTEVGKKPKTVTVIFPSGCTGAFECYYQKDNGKEVKVTKDSAEIEFTDNGTLVGKVTDGYNIVTSTHNVQLYIDATYNDGYYYCDQGYSRNNTTCSKTVTTTGTMNNKCPYGYSGGGRSYSCSKYETTYTSNYSCSMGYPQWGGGCAYSCTQVLWVQTGWNECVNGQFTGNRSYVSDSCMAQGGTPSVLYNPPGPLSWSNCQLCPASGWARVNCQTIQCTKYTTCTTYSGLYYICPYGWSGGGYSSLCSRTLTAQATTNYDCPSGYSGGGYSSVCSRVDTKTAYWHNPYYTCPSGYTLKGDICNLN